jgi:hypothetical protein
MPRFRTTVPVLVAALSLLSAGCAAAYAGGLAERAEAAMKSSDYGTAERLFAELAGDPGQRGYATFRRAVALLQLGRLDEARESLDQSSETGYTPAAIAFRRACAHALEGKVAAAIAELETAVANGLTSLSFVENEPMLAAVRSDPGYEAVKLALDRKARPCRHDPRHRAFDFWLGTWDVRPAGAPDTAPPSENVITLEHEGCVVVEHWKSVGGGTGSSFNIFDPTRGKWYQTWVDSTGGLHEYRGNPDEKGNMIFSEGDTPGGPGQPSRVPTRLSFFRLGPDRVRQLSEISPDGGNTWTVNYDLVYVRRRRPPA